MRTCHKKSTVYLLSLGAFALGMSSYVTAGLLPLVAGAFSVPVAIAAQLVTAFTLAYALGSPIFVAFLPGHLQRAGLMFALGLLVLANAASALSPTFSVLMLFRAIAGLGAGVYLAMAIAASASLSPFEQRGKAIAIIMGGMASGTVLGVPLSLLLAEHFGWTHAFWLIAILGMIALIGLSRRLPALPNVPASSLNTKLVLLTDRQVISILSVSLLAAIASLGMYTFIAPLLTSIGRMAFGTITPYLWIWGIGGVLGSFLIGLLVERVPGPVLALWIMLTLALALFLLPVSSQTGPWLVMLPIAVWGAVGWALQVPQNNGLIKAREGQGDGNLAVALNESALYLGSAIGAGLGGLILLLHWPVWILATGAGGIALFGALVQLLAMRANWQK